MATKQEASRLDTLNNTLNALLGIGSNILGFVSRSDLLAAVVGAVIGAVVGIAGLIWVERRKARKELQLRRRDRLGKYVAGIADHLGGMVEAFRLKQVPHTDGRAFVGLMHGFRDMLDDSLSPNIMQRLRTLEGLVYNAGRLDEHLYKLKDLSDLKQEKNKDFEEWILVAERLRGDLYAEARRLDMPQNS
jgi:hypothetical protein